MKKYKIISAPEIMKDWIGATYSLYVAAKLGWRRPDDGVKALHNMQLGCRIEDNDGWRWERVQ